MTSEINSINNLFQTHSNLSYRLNTRDSDGKKICLKYSQSKGWGYVRLSKFDAFLKILPDIILRFFGKTDIIESRLTTVFRQYLNDRDLLNNDIKLKVNTIFKNIFNNKNIEFHSYLTTLLQSQNPDTSLKSINTNTLSGIIKQNNDCYLISTLQSLLSSKNFINKIKNAKIIKIEKENEDSFELRKNLLNQLLVMIEEYDKPNTSDKKNKLSESLVEIGNIIHILYPNRFAEGRGTQQDAQEVIYSIFDALEINNLGITSKLTYKNETYDEKAEKFSCLDVDFNENLTTSISNYFIKEIIDDYKIEVDPNMNKKQKPKKNHKNKDKILYEKVRIEKQYQLNHPLPDLIPIRIKRFLLNDDNKHIKNSNPINVDLDIDLSSCVKNQGNDSAKYRVQSVVVHRGNSGEHGHYIAYVRKGNDWFLCNDAQVTPLGTQAPDLSQGYVFILEKIPN